MTKIRAAVIGGAGYTGGEMCRLLINHPNVELAYVQSGSNGGNFLYDVHSDLLGDTDMRFVSEVSMDVDVLFFCMGHGKGKEFLQKYDVPQNIKIIDLGNDFRLNDDASFAGRDFVYGLTDANYEQIKTASNVANPGCFATAIQLALLPLAVKGLLTDDINVSAVTGSTGAGQALSPTSHFSWRLSNLSTYKMFSHQHLGEIGETLVDKQPTFDAAVNFVPYRGDFARGIMATVYTKCDLSQEEAVELYKEYYKNSHFTFVSDKNIHLKQVVNSNKAILFVEKHGDNLVISSIIDNLLKGASGQAVENMNIMLGLDPKAGLRLKTLAF